MDSNSSNANKTQQMNFNLVEKKVINELKEELKGFNYFLDNYGEELQNKKNQIDKEYKKLEQKIKTQFDTLNSKYLEAWNLLHKIANEINKSLVIKKYQIDGRDFDLYEQERKLLNVKMEIFYQVENKVDLTENELEIMMGRALEQISKIYNQLVELKNNYEEFEKIEIENQKKETAKRKITINKIMFIIFFVLTLVCVALFVLILLSKKYL